MWCAQNPCFRLFRAALAFPAGVLGPVERRALARFAANCFCEIGCFACGVALFKRPIEPEQILVSADSSTCRCCSVRSSMFDANQGGAARFNDACHVSAYLYSRFRYSAAANARAMVLIPNQ